ncbi:helix-turn-helix domain-containing protein [Micromonospora zhanjiangensis]
MAEDMGSTVPRRQLGRALKELRLEARITLDGAAEALQCSRQKVWRIETGLGVARAPDVRAMCDLYGATPELTTALTGLATETKAKGWWHSYGDAIPDWFELYVGLESAASHLRGYDESLTGRSTSTGRRNLLPTRRSGRASMPSRWMRDNQGN